MRVALVLISVLFTFQFDIGELKGKLVKFNDLSWKKVKFGGVRSRCSWPKCFPSFHLPFSLILKSFRVNLLR